MKKITPFFLIAVIFLTSCSSEETVQADEALLKSYKITKDAQGRYSIDYEVKEDASVEVVKDIKSNFNEIHLFSGKVAMGNNRSELFLEDNKLKVGFFENNQNRKSVVIEDENIVLARGEESNEFLDSYSIEDLGEENYQLTFKVKEGTSVGFQYNEDLDTYEVHLKEGESNGLEFSKTYIRTSKELKINFVNYIKQYSSRSENADYELVEKPKVIFL